MKPMCKEDKEYKAYKAYKEEKMVEKRRIMKTWKEMSMLMTFL